MNHARCFDDMHSFIAAMAKRFPIGLAITVGHPAMSLEDATGAFTEAAYGQRLSFKHA